MVREDSLDLCLKVGMVVGRVAGAVIDPWPS